MAASWDANRVNAAGHVSDTCCKLQKTSIHLAGYAFAGRITSAGKRCGCRRHDSASWRRRASAKGS